MELKPRNAVFAVTSGSTGVWRQSISAEDLAAASGSGIRRGPIVRVLPPLPPILPPPPPPPSTSPPPSTASTIELELEQEPEPAAEEKPPMQDGRKINYHTIRGIVAYFILGLCNNYGYVVMLTAASDIIGEAAEHGSDRNSTVRENCSYMSTGTILLADILPALIIKIVAPFLPFVIHFRVAVCVALTGIGFLIVAFSRTIVVSISGVALISFCSGLGEVTYLQYSAHFKKSVLSAWSSGSGGAGVMGAISYSVLNYLGMTNTLVIMLAIPAMTAITFWVILPKPLPEDLATEAEQEDNTGKLRQMMISLRRKFYLLPGLMKYMLPFGLVYLFEYFINQGTFELIKYPDAPISEASQYRWMQAIYQVGVFVSRSSVLLFHIRATWIMTVLQAINVIIFTTQAIYLYIPSIYIVLFLVLWEGLLGGASYVNTYYRISTEVKPEDRQFSMAINGFADSTGIALAGVFAIMAHNAICNIPLPY